MSYYFLYFFIRNYLVGNYLLRWQLLSYARYYRDSPFILFYASTPYDYERQLISNKVYFRNTITDRGSNQCLLFCLSTTLFSYDV